MKPFTPSPQDLQALSAAAAAADANGALDAATLALLQRSGWLNMLAPRSVGGGEWALPDVVRLEEAVAAADGSAGWVLTLCAGAAWFAGFWPHDLARRVLATPGVCLAGSGASTGVAERDGAGWRVSGHWTHASGAPWATHFTFNAALHDGGQPLLDATGQPRVRAFVVTAADVTLHKTWHSQGLRASRSDAFELRDAWVPDEQVFDIDVDAATHDGPLYCFPFRAFACVTLAANLLGLARRFMELAEPLITQRLQRRPAAAGEARALQHWRAGSEALRRARADLHAALDAAWQQASAGQVVPLKDAQRLEALSQALVATARDAVSRSYPACGLWAADERSDINRVWRDFHTATQHAIWLE